MQRSVVCAGKLVGTVDRLEVPVSPEHVVLKHRYSVWMRHADAHDYSTVAVQIRRSSHVHTAMPVVIGLIFNRSRPALV